MMLPATPPTAYSSRPESIVAMWMRGEFRDALAAADQALAMPAHAGDVRLIRARVECLRRLRRAGEAVAYARSVQVPAGDPEHVQRALILALALISTNAWQETEDVLRAASAHCTGDEHEDVLVYRSIAATCHGRYDDALAMLRGVRPRDSFCYVKRLETEATLAHLRLDLTTAAALADEALTRLMRIPHEALLEFKLLSFLGNLACERLDVDAWLRIAKGYGDLHTISADWMPRFTAHRQQSNILEMLGVPLDALRSADEMTAPSLPQSLQLQGLCRKALIFFRYGERLAFAELAGQVKARYRAHGVTDVQHPLESQTFLMVAEVLALDGDADAADAVLRDRASHAHVASAWHDYTTDVAEHEFVRGLIADARGKTLRARHHFRSAFETFRRAGFARYAVIAGQRLMAVDRDEDVVRYIDERARAFAPDSWLRRDVNRHVADLRQPALRELTRAERGVLRLLLEGKTTAEIAHEHGRSQRTVRNTVSALLKTFGVENRQALICECLRRGMGPILR